MLYRQILIQDNREIAPHYFLMKLASTQIARNSSPGQFLHIKCSNQPTCHWGSGGQAGNNNPLLRRPLSIHRVTDEKYIEILYKVVGKGTYYLSQRKKGEKIDCIGPLGKGFALPQSAISNQQSKAILIAGGVGIAPLIFLTEKLAQSETRNPKSEIAVFVGAKTKDEILCTQELKKSGAEIHIATEDGSLGYKGLVSTLLKNKLSTINHKLSTSMYACGPKGMLKEVALLCGKHKIPCQVSFEQFMGCGIGICNSCVIRTKHGYKRVCKDGPVFWAEDIDWEKT